MCKIPGLPAELQDICIPEGKRMILTHRCVGDSMWVVMITRVKGQRSSAWQLSLGDYWHINIDGCCPSRDRIVRSSRTPTLVDPTVEPQQTELFSGNQ